MILAEGGNVFKDVQSEPIKREDINPTLKAFFAELKRIFPRAAAHFQNVGTLGSVGKKAVSGDIDLSFDEKAFKNLEDWNIDEADVKELFNKFKAKSRSASDAMIIKRAIITLIAEQIVAESNEISADIKQAGQGTLFTQFPQYTPEGQKNGKYVQIDINFGNPEWLKFAYNSAAYPEGSNVKGLHATQLMLHLFVNKGYVFSHNYGVKNKETNEVVASTPEQAINLLNKLYGFNVDRETLSDYYKLQDFLKKNVPENELNHIYDIYLKTLDSTRCDIPSDLQNYFLDNQERLGLKGKYLPSTSKLYPFRDLD